VIATVHVGTAGYYKQLRAMIDDMESAGAVVYYEAANPATQQEWAAASDEERAALEGAHRAQPDISQSAGRSLGWVDQWTALGSSPSWRNADMSSLEYVRQAGPQNLLSVQRDYGGDRPGQTQEMQQAFADAGGYTLLLRLTQFTWFDALRRLAMRLLGGAARRIDEV
jgi:hypothetical protein